MENVDWSKECKKRFSETQKINSEIRKLEKQKKEVGSYYIIDVLAEKISQSLNMKYIVDNRSGSRIHFYKNETPNRKIRYARSVYTISFSGISYEYKAKDAEYFNKKTDKWELLPKTINEIVDLIINHKTGWEPKGD